MGTRFAAGPRKTKTKTQNTIHDESPGASPHDLIVFTAPALPLGVVAVDSGALLRIYKFVKTIKASPHYTEAVGLQYYDDAAPVGDYTDVQSVTVTP